MSQSQRFNVVLEVKAGPQPAAVKMRALLKHLLRSWGVRCVKIEEVKPSTAETSDK